MELEERVSGMEKHLPGLSRKYSYTWMEDQGMKMFTGAMV